MTQPVVVTIPIAESGEQEEAVNERIVDAGFAPAPPHAGDVKVYAEGTTYAKGDLVRESGKSQIYRSTENANKEHKPASDTDYVHWQPMSLEEYVLQNPAFVTEDKTYTLKTREEIVGVPTDPGAEIYPWLAATTYLTGRYATEAGIGYESIKASNTNHKPSTSSEWWKALGPAIRLGV